MPRIFLNQLLFHFNYVLKFDNGALSLNQRDWRYQRDDELWNLERGTRNNAKSFHEEPLEEHTHTYTHTTSSGLHGRRDRRKKTAQHPHAADIHTYKLGRYFITEGSMETVERDVPVNPELHTFIYWEFGNVRD